MPDCDGAGTVERNYPTSEVRRGGREEIPSIQVRGGDERSYPTSEVRDGGWEEISQALKPKARGGGGEEQPHARGRGGGREDQPHALAAGAQKGLEELSHVEGQEGQW